MGRGSELTLNFWSCPKCGRRFARQNQKHVCGQWTVEQHLAGRSPTVIALYKRFVEMVRVCGPFEYSPVRSQIGFRVQRIFAGVKLTEHALEGYLDLPKIVKSQRFRNISPYQSNLFVHHFRVRSLNELNDQFAAWVRESYTVGEGWHRAKGKTTVRP